MLEARSRSGRFVHDALLTKRPVEAVRVELRRILDATSLWDGKDWSLQVTNTTDRCPELRTSMSATDASKAWDLSQAAGARGPGRFCQHPGKAGAEYPIEIRAHGMPQGGQGRIGQARVPGGGIGSGQSVGRGRYDGQHHTAVADIDDNQRKKPAVNRLNAAAIETSLSCKAMQRASESAEPVPA